MPSLYSIIRGMLFEALAAENPQRTVGDTYEIVDALLKEHQIEWHIRRLMAREEEGAL